jgi:hypothetical protein
MIAVLIGGAVGAAVSTFAATGVPDCLIHLEQAEREALYDREVRALCKGKYHGHSRIVTRLVNL